ncbi:MAG: hypothetical protein ABIQ88_17900 [Chitinophagaceae bacterium]
MKKIIFAMLLIAGTQAFAQQTRSGITAYGALSAQYSKFSGKNAVFTGAYGGVLLHHKLLLGAGAYALTTKHSGYGLNENSHQPNNWRMGYGGLVAEYTFLENKNMHFTAGALAGGGIVKNGKGRGTIPANGSDELKDVDASGFYVVQPSVALEVIAARWMRISAGVGYRYVAGSDQPGISNKDMSAPTASLTVKFGLF